MNTDEPGASVDTGAGPVGGAAVDNAGDVDAKDEKNGTGEGAEVDASTGDMDGKELGTNIDTDMDGGDADGTGVADNSHDASTAAAPATAPNLAAAVAPPPLPLHLWKEGEIVMVDTSKDDVPLKMEYYMRNALPEFIQREPSLFVRTLLETVLQRAQTTNSMLLRRALELWGLVEILDRERQWQIRVKPATDDAASGDLQQQQQKQLQEQGDGQAQQPPPQQIRPDTDQDTYTTLCLQLTAAAERKAAATSHSLLTTMQRLLQDSKTKIDCSMYFATLLLLTCVEKATWGFTAWDQAEGLRALWPLERSPQEFAQQGYVIADLLRMLLGIRRALPRTTCRPADGQLVAEDAGEDPVVRDFFAAIKLNYDDVVAKQEHPVFSPTDSRSFELLFCSSLLLPARD
ncbi:hypothetical protein SPI_07709 [Niveomyces insectorum RCEF 264]|uniref:Uncharacterized protein n=1 Tax=Niveomyces insectorum RCEF 264 TaxID=1081102 RepID=A0A167PIU6_9HYPO|nr:hypothetical protein SPI_07709 [Niveomyces insectorum RCEF 264]